MVWVGYCLGTNMGFWECAQNRHVTKILASFMCNLVTGFKMLGIVHRSPHEKDNVLQFLALLKISTVMCAK